MFEEPGRSTSREKSKVRLISLEHCPTGGDLEHVFLFFVLGTVEREGGERERERERERDRELTGAVFPRWVGGRVRSS